MSADHAVPSCQAQAHPGPAPGEAPNNITWHRVGWLHELFLFHLHLHCHISSRSLAMCARHDAPGNAQAGRRSLSRKDLAMLVPRRIHS
jgi:hypothetical protein